MINFYYNFCNLNGFLACLLVAASAFKQRPAVAVLQKSSRSWKRKSVAMQKGFGWKRTQIFRLLPFRNQDARSSPDALQSPVTDTQRALLTLTALILWLVSNYFPRHIRIIFSLPLNGWRMR
jgi:hypothetical protein